MSWPFFVSAAGRIKLPCSELGKTVGVAVFEGEEKELCLNEIKLKMSVRHYSEVEETINSILELR